VEEDGVDVKKFRKILLVTATNVETKSVFEVFKVFTNQIQPTISNGIYQLGKVGGVNITLIQITNNTQSVSGAIKISISDAIKENKLSAIIMVGAASGINSSRMKIGDILISDAIRPFDIGLSDQGILWKDSYFASTDLLRFARNVERNWRKSSVFYGNILSTETLVNSSNIRNNLKATNNDAIGIEMEGEGFAKAAFERAVDWIVVKGVADRADSFKTNLSSITKAVKNATEFVLLMIQLMSEPANLSNEPSKQTLKSKLEVPDTLHQQTVENLELKRNKYRRFVFNDGVIEKHVSSDEPIHHVRLDKLEFRTYVNALQDFIVSKFTSTPMTIAIDGAWGSGKSSLMFMLKNRLDPQRGIVRKFFESINNFRNWIVWFSKFQIYFHKRWFGKLIIKIFVREDVDDSEIHLYIGDNSPHFKKSISDIVEGFSIDPETINEPGFENIEEGIRNWASVNAAGEPMSPPYQCTVWLNAWKFDNQEEVWASLAMSTLDQIKHKHSMLWRVWFWLDLTFHRFKFFPAIKEIGAKFLIPVIFALLAGFYKVLIDSFDIPFIGLYKLGEPILWAGFTITGIIEIASIFKDPFQISLDKVFDHPIYKDKVSFLAHFEKDFARIVHCATKNGWGWKRSKLVIFIDDLDRCKPPKAADIVEAINLFLDVEGCVFVVGMDSEAVAMSIEEKYKELFERIRAGGSTNASLGRSFLEKIVQIPFKVPLPSISQVMHLVDDNFSDFNILESESTNDSFSTNQENTDKSGATINTSPINNLNPKENGNSDVKSSTYDVASLARIDVQNAIQLGVSYLVPNPRQVKTFINLFRLSIYIANERQLLDERIVGDDKKGINLETLAIWTVVSIRWPNIIKYLQSKSDSILLCSFLKDIARKIPATQVWPKNGKIPLEIIKDLEIMREEEKKNSNHWCELPWERWLMDDEFRKIVKEYQFLWASSSEGINHDLRTLLMMTKPITPQVTEEI
jgi:nucleoside phosphorylase